MKIQFVAIGKNHEAFLKEGIELFTKRITHYYAIDWVLLQNLKNAASLSADEVKAKEGEQILTQIKKEDYLVLLDERGKQLDSPGLAQLMGTQALHATKTIVFVIGGAFGVSQAVTQRSNLVWSLSKLVFPHQLVRLILAEQVYRACTILRNEKYHHT